MKKNKKQIILRSIILVVISLIVGLGVYSWNARNLTGNVMPMPFGVGVGVVLSGSMEPELSKDDLIIVAKQDEYSVGETVVFQDGYILVVHEIIKIDGETVTTKGKANTGSDAPIKMSDIKGKVVLAIPFVGMIVSALKTPLATMLILALAIWLLVKSYQGEKKEEDEALDRIREEIEKLKAARRADAPATEESALPTDTTSDTDEQTTENVEPCSETDSTNEEKD